MATCDAQAILKWHKVIGTIEPGKRADLIVLAGKAGDPYEALIRAKETSIRLVMINGVPRYGLAGMLDSIGVKGETLRVGGTLRRLFLEQETADPDVAAVSISAAKTALRKAFRDLPKLARELEAPRPKSVVRDALDAPEPLVWSLALDEIRDTGIELRPRLPFNGPRDFTGPKRTSLRAASAPLSSILKPITLDPLTVADDPNFLIEIANQPNVPESVRNGLSGLY